MDRKHAQRCHLIRKRNGSYDNIVLVTCVLGTEFRRTNGRNGHSHHIRTLCLRCAFRTNNVSGERGEGDGGEVTYVSRLHIAKVNNARGGGARWIG
jgi:hypothetical protein